MAKNYEIVNDMNSMNRTDVILRKGKNIDITDENTRKFLEYMENNRFEEAHEIIDKMQKKNKLPQGYIGEENKTVGMNCYTKMRKMVDKKKKEYNKINGPIEFL